MLVGLYENFFVDFLSDELANRVWHTDIVPHAMKLMLVVVGTDGLVDFLVDWRLYFNPYGLILGGAGYRSGATQQVEVYLHQ